MLSKPRCAILCHLCVALPPFLPLAPAMTEAFRGIWEVACSKGLPLRTAAFVIALQRVAQARANRGFD